VANDPGGYRTVGTAFELGLLTDGSGVSTRAVLIDSIMKFFGIIAPGVEEQPAQFSTPVRTMMTQVVPNPLFRNASIRYQLARQSQVSLEIFDATGRIVRTLEKGMRQPGYYTVTWDGKDNIGRSSAAGVYFIRFRTDDCTMVQKAVVVR
jgi:hypothetical protein